MAWERVGEPRLASSETHESQRNQQGDDAQAAQLYTHEEEDEEHKEDSEH